MASQCRCKEYADDAGSGCNDTGETCFRSRYQWEYRTGCTELADADAGIIACPGSEVRSCSSCSQSGGSDTSVACESTEHDCGSIGFSVGNAFNASDGNQASIAGSGSRSDT